MAPSVAIIQQQKNAALFIVKKKISARMEKQNAGFVFVVTRPLLAEL